MLIIILHTIENKVKIKESVKKINKYTIKNKKIN